MGSTRVSRRATRSDVTDHQLVAKRPASHSVYFPAIAAPLVRTGAKVSARRPLGSRFAHTMLLAPDPLRELEELNCYSASL